MRILGVDRGSTSIKAIELESAFGRIEFIQVHEEVIRPDRPAARAIQSLLRSLPKIPDRIVCALSAGQCMMRNLSLPTRDRRAIQAGVNFELEDELPVNAEDLHYDYVILNRTRQLSQVHVAATLKTTLRDSLNQWEEEHLFPDWVTSQAWAYRQILNHAVADEIQVELPVLLLQLGRQRSLAYLHWQGAPAALREIPWGGELMTRAVADKYATLHYLPGEAVDLPPGEPPPLDGEPKPSSVHSQQVFDEAERLKLAHGALFSPDGVVDSTNPGASNTIPADVPLEDAELAQILERPLRDLLPHLRQMEFIAKSITRRSIHAIYLTGGASLLPGIGEWLSSRMRVEVKPLQALGNLGPSGVRSGPAARAVQARFALAGGLALAGAPIARQPNINFRKKEFAKQGRKHDLSFSSLRKPLLASGLIFGSLYLSLIVQIFEYGKQLSQVDLSLEKSVKAFFSALAGNISSSATRSYLSNPTKLRTDVEKELKKARDTNLIFGPNHHFPLDLLQTLSLGIPKSLTTDLVRFKLTPSPNESYFEEKAPPSLSVTFQFPRQAEADELDVILRSQIGGLVRGAMEELSKTGKADPGFRATWSGIPHEQAYDWR